MKSEIEEKSRKIELPNYCCALDVNMAGGDKDCDHDYPPESKVENDTYVLWTCSRCDMKTSFGVFS